MASAGVKRKLQTRTYEQKYEIIKFVESNPGMKQKAIATKFDIRPQTLSDILKKKSKIIETMENKEKVAAEAGSFKRVKKVSYAEVNTALLLWVKQVSVLPETRIDSETLRLKAEFFAREFGYEEVAISLPWVERFKRRWGIAKVKKTGESGGIDYVTVQEWKNGRLQEICSRFKPQDIFNADETGLFWQMLPENTLGFIGSKGKQPKSCFTVLVAANMDGSEKLPLLVIGKSKKPHDFKGVRHLPVKYKANRNAWMNGEIFESWVKSLDHNMGLQNRRICLVVDNCPAHPQIEGLKHIELIFLPSNTPSLTQPMDGGVIRNLKFHYRHILANRRLQAAESGSPFQWNILDALFAVKDSWSMVKQSTIANVYRKVGFVIKTHEGETEQPAPLPSDDKVHCLQVEEQDDSEVPFRNIWTRLSEIFGEGLTTLDEYVDVDRGDGNVHHVMTDNEIVEEVLARHGASVEIGDDEERDDDGDKNTSQQPDVPSVKLTYDAIDVIRRFALSMAESPEVVDALAFAQKMETLLLKETPNQLKKTDYFQTSHNNMNFKEDPDQQVCNQERNSSRNQEHPDTPQIKEEREELRIGQEGEQLVVKQEAEGIIVWTGEERLRLLDTLWKPEIKLDLPEQHDYKEEDALSDQQVCNQEGNFSLDQEPPQIKEEQELLCTSQEGEQLIVKQEVDTFMVIPVYKGSEPGPNLDQELPQIKEEQEELCTNQEGEQLVVKPEVDTFMVTPAYEESETGTNLDQEPSQIKEEQEELCTSQEREQFLVKQEVKTFIVTRGYEESEPGPNGDQLLSYKSSEPEGQAQVESKHVDSGLTRNAELKNTSHETNRSHSNRVGQLSRLRESG
ncbi:tigger transposable element-derived protein 4-like isoform X1 [Archocentrus centrarchus]|uniref:tigger transposable element-derived protein 4-like isoform X1 n=1 Tax=Archocentrus centrarchus TaxID=63155 RepID=UPI0011EA406C|nr:tigger transposable element-derived protein 4-like isoform X1 [Archocentrus centrarchus]